MVLPGLQLKNKNLERFWGILEDFKQYVERFTDNKTFWKKNGNKWNMKIASENWKFKKS